ncbi:MAG: hypothetical protein ABII79_05545 [bacterium]
MKITLEIVRQTLRDALGFNSFTAGFISSVEEDHTMVTAGITKDGRLGYNRQFVARNITCKEDLFCLVFHELLHPMFNHFIYDNGPLESLATDAVINAVVSNLYREESGHGHLFKKLYSQRGVEGLLRPLSVLYSTRFEDAYHELYGNGATRPGITTGELITTLKILLEANAATCVLFLGSHGTGSASHERWPSETLQKIADDIKRSAADRGGQMAGYHANLVSMLMEALRTHLAIKRAILQRFTTNRKLDRFTELFKRRRVCASPVPLYPSKRDLVLLATGFYPSFFHNQITTPAKKDKGLAAYLDVSGSVEQYLPKILGILSHLKREITSVFLFSNKVVEVPFQQLLKGKITTTYGTDFDCVAESIIDHQFDKAVIITDGYASMLESNKARLHEQKTVTLAILFDKAHRCSDFEEFGDVVRLEDVCQ